MKSQVSKLVIMTFLLSTSATATLAQAASNPHNTAKSTKESSAKQYTDNSVENYDIDINKLKVEISKETSD